MRLPTLIRALLLTVLLLVLFYFSQPINGEEQSSLGCELPTQTEALTVLINDARAATTSCGGVKYTPSSPLAASCALTQSAQSHAETLFKTDRLSHRGAGNSSLGDRVTASGYQWSGVSENIAKGQNSPQALIDDWLASSKHCENMLKNNYRDIGIGHAGAYWVAVFATPLQR